MAGSRMPAKKSLWALFSVAGKAPESPVVASKGLKIALSALHTPKLIPIPRQGSDQAFCGTNGVVPRQYLVEAILQHDPPASISSRSARDQHIRLIRYNNTPSAMRFVEREVVRVAQRKLGCE